MPLDDYRRKRNFAHTPEPPAHKGHGNGERHHFVIQKHQASHLHYDLRLESEGTLKSWAVPKGLPLHASEKHLAIQVEDHPVSYKEFEGIIPEGNYGAGTVMVWDEGEYKIIPPHEGNGSKRMSNPMLFRQGLKKGHLKLFIEGRKIKGNYSLVRTGNERKEWLLINRNTESTKDISIFKDNQSVKTGRTMEEIGHKQDVSTARGIAKLLGMLHLKESPMPDFVPPMLATLTQQPFDRKDWVFEIKWDGYRCLAWKKGTDVKLFSRNRRLYNEAYPEFIGPIKIFPFDVIFDGEIVAFDKEGRPNFQLLQNHSHDPKGYLIYYIFDLLYIHHYDLRGLRLTRRKEILRKCLINQPELLRYSEDFPEKGKSFFEAARRHQIEGVIAKKADSHYISGKRTLEWLKIKTENRQEALICGYTKPKGSRHFFGALILGVHDGGRLRYIGHTGTGFDEALLESLHDKLKPLSTRQCPFEEKPATNGPVTWVKPRLIAEIKFSEWTTDGIMRHPVFVGLRVDKEPQDVIREKTNDVTLKPTLSHLDKIYWPKEKITKGQLIEYYQQIAPLILKYIKDRPQSLRRHPDGILSKGFFHKNMDHQAPDWVKTVSIDSGSHGTIEYLLCQDRDTLAYMNNLGCIEINPWHSRIGHLAHPDYIVLDLDPVEIAFTKVVEVARGIKELLDELTLSGFCKTSGGRGIHIYVPLKEDAYDFEQGKTFAHLLSTLVHARFTKITSLERRPSQRRKKIYLDYLQNKEAQTLVAPYSVRPREGAPVSTPLRWSELTTKLDPLDFNLHTMHDRLQNTGDLWEDLFEQRADINKVLSKIERKDHEKIRPHQRHHRRA